MAVRENNLQINDLENQIQQCRKDLENLQLFESSQSVSSKEMVQLVEQRRKKTNHLQVLEAQVSELQIENMTFVCIYLFIFLIAILCHHVLACAESQSGGEQSWGMEQTVSQSTTAPSNTEDKV